VERDSRIDAEDVQKDIDFIRNRIAALESTHPRTAKEEIELQMYQKIRSQILASKDNSQSH
jgi:hypothetical protein